MKVGLLVGSFAGGGAERMMINLAKGFDKKKIEVRLYVVNKKGSYLKEIPSRLNIYDLNASNGVKSVIHKIRNILKNDNLSVIISTQMHINSALGLASLGLRKRPKIIFREASTPSEIINSRVLCNVFRWTYKLADHHVAVSNGVKDDMAEYLKLPKDQISVIYNPVVDCTIKKKMYEEVIHPWFLDHSQIPIIVGMGRFSSEKNFEDLIEAFALLRKKRVARLVIFGNRNKEKKYYSSILGKVKQLNLEEDIDFPGFVDNPFKYFRNASLFVLSSKFEGLPGVLIQAMACGCPVVSTDCPSGPREILQEGKYGPLVAIGDCKGLADAMIKTLDNPIASKLLMQRANYFSKESSTKNYLRLFEKVMV